MTRARVCPPPECSKVMLVNARTNRQVLLGIKLRCVNYLDYLSLLLKWLKGRTRHSDGSFESVRSLSFSVSLTLDGPLSVEHVSRDEFRE